MVPVISTSERVFLWKNQNILAFGGYLEDTHEHLFSKKQCEVASHILVNRAKHCWLSSHRNLDCGFLCGLVVISDCMVCIEAPKPQLVLSSDLLAYEQCDFVKLLDLLKACFLHL